jgi:hypothetical protein
MSDGNSEHDTRLFMYLPFMSYLDVIVNVDPVGQRAAGQRIDSRA